MDIQIPVSALKRFRRRLTNLSSRNRSLLLTTLPASQFLDLHEADFLLNKSSFSLIADLIGRKPSVALCDVLDARQGRSNEVSRKLRRIDRTARFIEQERGTEDLYVGWPFVRGKFLDDTVVHAPLLFFPVQIEQQGKAWKLVRRGDELAFLNPTLMLAYGQFNQVRLPDDVLEKTADSFDKDPLIFRTQLYEWLKTSPLELNFNPDLFTDTLHFFDKQPARNLAALERPGELKLYPEAVLGIFPQAGSFLVPDYDTLIEEEESRKRGEEEGDEPDDSFLPFPVSPSAPFLLSSSPAFLPEKFIYAPLPMDASQEVAVRTVKAGHSLVVQGPPGTGKSQLIANLMADAAASGKRTLLVCQKRAALDVVYERLRQVGIAPFLAIMHDFQDDRRALYAQIARQIEQVDAYRQQNNSLNSVLLERNFEIESRRIDEAVTTLQAFKDALFDTSACGLSAKELYLTSDPDGPTMRLDDVYQQFSFTTVDDFLRRLTDYAAYQQQLGPKYVWADRLSFAKFGSADLPRIDALIGHWQQTTKTSREELTTLVGTPLSFDEIIRIQHQAQALTELVTLLQEQETPTLWPIVLYLRYQPNHPALAATETYLAETSLSWDKAMAAPGPEQTLPAEQLQSFRALLTEALMVRSSWIRWNGWLLTNSGKKQLRQTAAVNQLSLSEADLVTLLLKIDKRLEADRIEQATRPLFVNLPLPAGPAGLRTLRRARILTDRIIAQEALRNLPETSFQTPRRLADDTLQLIRVGKVIADAHTTGREYLTDTQLRRIWQDETIADLLRTTLRRQFDWLVDADRLMGTFQNAEQLLIERLATSSPAVWIERFQNALRLAWLSHLEQLQPDLRSVSSLSMSQIERGLQASLQQKQVLSRDIMLVRLREQTYRNLTFNRLNNVITYRDLLHQTTKKRNVWPVRKLMESFASEVFKLVPCWLASPESVSAMFPLRADLFDLVIFDEASQCFTESGIPAMLRGRQVVITGDSQQLRPSDLYRTRLDEPEADEEVAPMLETESLLEFAAQHLPQVSLKEHYRSRSLDLITFSNEHFYQNKLALIPDFDDVNRREPAIRYLNVKGIWQQNTNPTEAEAVVSLLDELSHQLPGRSIGIVTFNYAQQQLIQDLLDNRAHDRSESQLFVKNIENVQGDERDVIIFSVGYAPDERGRLSMQFGSLNARGGENRLNVAVTRARERIYIVTSLWPDQLRVNDAVNPGPVLLRSYLTYALAVAQDTFRPTVQPYEGFTSEALLKNKLTAAHPDWQPILPFADLTVVGDPIYQSLVLTDDDLYYQQSVKQAHAYLPLLVQTRQWPYQRFWSRNAWLNADLELSNNSL